MGLVLDSAVFLYLAFGSGLHRGQIIGKLIMVALAVPIIKVYRDRNNAVPANFKVSPFGWHLLFIFSDYVGTT